MEKLNQYFGFVDTLQLIDTSDANHILLAQFKGGVMVNFVPYDKLPDWFQKYLPGLAKRLK